MSVTSQWLDPLPDELLFLEEPWDIGGRQVPPVSPRLWAGCGPDTAPSCSSGTQCSKLAHKLQGPGSNPSSPLHFVSQGKFLSQISLIFVIYKENCESGIVAYACHSST